MIPSCRAPCGARGLKSLIALPIGIKFRSRSLRSAWIEMAVKLDPKVPGLSRSLRSAWIEMLVVNHDIRVISSRSLRSAWIEISLTTFPHACWRSRSLRSAWIEIVEVSMRLFAEQVALPAERVD